MTKPLRHPHAPLAASAPTKLGGLGDFVLGRPWKPYIVAEIGVNHEGSLGRALELITAAADAGAHCAKFQAYKADRLVHESAAPYWDVSRETAKSQRALFRKYDAFGANEYEQLATACADAGIHFACTSFDLEAVAMLDPLVTWWKIASGDITYRALLRAVAATRKPVVFSTGAATWGEIEDALGTMGAVNPGGSVIPLHCILSYPTKPEDVRLATIHTLGEFLRDRWGIQHIGDLREGRTSMNDSRACPKASTTAPPPSAAARAVPPRATPPRVQYLTGA